MLMWKIKFNFVFLLFWNLVRTSSWSIINDHENLKKLVSILNTQYSRQERENRRKMSLFLVGKTSSLMHSRLFWISMQANFNIREASFVHIEFVIQLGSHSQISPKPFWSFKYIPWRLTRFIRQRPAGWINQNPWIQNQLSHFHSSCHVPRSTGKSISLYATFSLSSLPSPN